MNKNYISFSSILLGDFRIRENTDLEKWVLENVDKNDINYTYSTDLKKPIMLGVYNLDREQRVVFKLKFGI